MKEVYYFQHDYNARNDPKLQDVLIEHGASGLGVFWCIVEQLYEQDGVLPLKMCKSIAFALHIDCKMVESVVNDFGLFQTDGENFWSNSVKTRLDKRKEVTESRKKAAIKRWESAQKMQMQCKNDANAMQDISKEKKRKGKENKVNNNNIPPTPPKGDGINYKARLIFENHFKTTFENNYYWTAKDAGSMDGLLQKLKFSRKQKKLSEDDESVLNALQAFLSSIQEGWIFENFSVSNLNSKFNEIVSSIKSKENKLKNQKGGDNGATRKDFNDGTVDQTTGETPKNYKKRF